MHQNTRPRQLVRSLCQLALICTGLLAFTPIVSAQYIVEDPKEIAESVKNGNTLMQQLGELKNAVDLAKQLLATTGQPGPLQTPSTYTTGNYINSIKSGITDPERYGAWIPKDGTAPDFATIQAAREFFRQALTGMSLNKNGIPELKTFSADTQPLIQKRRISEYNEAALNAVSVAAQTPASIKITIDQAEQLSAKGRAASSEREQLSVLIDGISALTTEVAMMRIQQAALLRLDGARALYTAPTVWDGGASASTKLGIPK